eukprot:637194_1
MVLIKQLSIVNKYWLLAIVGISFYSILVLSYSMFLPTDVAQDVQSMYPQRMIKTNNYALFKEFIPFFDYFSSLYENHIDWTLYEYITINSKLMMIQINKTHKSQIISNLRNANIEHTKLKHQLSMRMQSLLRINSPMIDRKHKLIYTLIPKNTCTVFKTLFMGIYANISYGLNYYYLNRNIHNDQSHNHTIFLDNVTEYIAILKDAEWTKFVIIRDPVDRLLSAFKDKCVHCKLPSGCRLCSHRIAYMAMQNTTKSFDTFVRWIGTINERNDHPKGSSLQRRRHFGLQLYFGLLDLYLPYYDYIIVYEKPSIAALTKLMLENMGSEYSKYYYHWNAQWILNRTVMTHNSSSDFVMFEKNTKHASVGFDDNNISWSRKRMDTVMDLLQNDYKYLPIPPRSSIKF